MAAFNQSESMQSHSFTRPKSDATISFRDIIPEPDSPKVKGIENCDALSWCASKRQKEGPAQLIHQTEAKNLETPYKGFITDGRVREGVHKRVKDGGAPVEAMKAAAEELLFQLSDEQRHATEHASVEDDQFKLWPNSHMYINPGGLRLDQVSRHVQEAVHDLLKASFSPAGYEKIHGCCLTNGFLGHLVNGKKVINERSYNFRLFGRPALAGNSRGGIRSLATIYVSPS